MRPTAARTAYMQPKLFWPPWPARAHQVHAIRYSHIMTQSGLRARFIAAVSQLSLGRAGTSARVPSAFNSQQPPCKLMPRTGKLLSTGAQVLASLQKHLTGLHYPHLI